MVEHERQRLEHKHYSAYFKIVAVNRFVVVNRGENRKPRKQRDERIEHANHNHGLADLYVFARVRAVGNHYAHTEREREKRLTHRREYSVKTERAEIGVEIIIKPVGNAFAQAKAINNYRHEYQKQRRHKHLARLFYSALNARHNDHERKNQKYSGIKDDFAYIPRKRAENFRVLFKGIERKLYGISAENRVITDYEKRNNYREKPQPTEVFVRFFISGNGIRLRAFAEVHFRKHNDGTDNDNAEYVHENERSTAVRAGFVRETPQIPKPYGRARRRKDKTYAAGKAVMLSFCVLHNDFLLLLIKNILPLNNAKVKPSPISKGLTSYQYRLLYRYFMPKS